MKLHTVALSAIALTLACSTWAMAQNARLNPISGNVRLNAGFTPDPYRVSVYAGGGTDASRLSSSCAGKISEAPDFRLTYDAGSYALSFRTEASADTTLVVNGPDGSWYCDDDGGGSLNAEVRFNNPRSGVYDVWIGSYGGDLVSGALLVTESASGGGGYSNGGGQSSDRPRGMYDNGDNRRRDDNRGGSRGGAPDSSLTANFGEIRLDSGFTPDPYRIDLVAGGSYDASALGGYCVGKISAAPDLQVTYDSSFLPLVIRTRSRADTTLVVNGPDGRWYCDDDTGGDSNAEVRFNSPQSGVYDIWVGTYGEDTASTSLSITETP